MFWYAPSGAAGILIAFDARRRIVSLDDVPLPLVERYAIGQCTPEELAELEAWIGGRPERRRFIERLHSLFTDSGRESEASLTFTEGDIERAWDRLAERMAAEGTRERERSARRRRVAAVVVVCVVAGVVLWLVVAR